MQSDITRLHEALKTKNFPRIILRLDDEILSLPSTPINIILGIIDRYINRLVPFNERLVSSYWALSKGKVPINRKNLKLLAYLNLTLHGVPMFVVDDRGETRDISEYSDMQPKASRNDYEPTLENPKERIRDLSNLIRSDIDTMENLFANYEFAERNVLTRYIEKLKLIVNSRIKSVDDGSGVRELEYHQLLLMELLGNLRQSKDRSTANETEEEKESNRRKAKEREEIEEFHRHLDEEERKRNLKEREEFKRRQKEREDEQDEEEEERLKAERKDPKRSKREMESIKRVREEETNRRKVREREDREEREESTRRQKEREETIGLRGPQTPSCDPSKRLHEVSTPIPP